MHLIQWRMVNHAEVKAFLGDAYLGKLNRMSRIKGPGHHAHAVTFTANSDGTGDQLYVPLGDYIARMESGRLVPVDAEVFQRLLANSRI